MALLKAKDALQEDVAKRPSVSCARYGGMEDAERYDHLINSEKAGAYDFSEGH